MIYLPDKDIPMIIDCASFSKFRQSAVKNAKAIRLQNLKKEADKIRKKKINDIGMCEICGFGFKPILQIHHIVPMSEFGTNQSENIICVCPNCHKTLHHLYSMIKSNKNISLSEINHQYFQLVSEQMVNVLSRWVEMKEAIVSFFEDIGFINTSEE